MTARAVGASRPLLLSALKLFHAWKHPATPRWAKAVIVGALGYLILPLDLIPDAIPALGLTDDLGVLLGALGTLASLISPDVTRRAEASLDQWVGGSAKAAGKPPEEKPS